jgi:hypothetical protein
MTQILDRVLRAARQLGACDVHRKAGLQSLAGLVGNRLVTDDATWTSRGHADPKTGAPGHDGFEIEGFEN